MLGEGILVLPGVGSISWARGSVDLNREDLEARWGRTASAWLTFPEVLVTHRRPLGLTFAELTFVLALQSFNVSTRRAPHPISPSARQLAQAMGLPGSGAEWEVSKRQLRKWIASLERKGVLKRRRVQQRISNQEGTTEFDLSPLMRRIEVLAPTDF